MKKILSFLMVIAITLFAFVSCEQSTPAPEVVPETDMYGVQIGRIENYQGLDATVTIQSEAVTRAGFIDQLYTISIEKPNKVTLNFLLTAEEFPEENKVVVTQYDEFWNEMAAMIYIDKRLTGIVVYDAPVLTRGWFSDWWDCTTAKFRECQKILEEDDDFNVICSFFEMTCNVAAGIVAGARCAGL